jgi:phytoene dehydrogenase-like protein
VKIPLLIIGSGLSGLAAAIRYARYSPNVLILEKHSRVGGLNSYFYRNDVLIETGLHAITNYAGPKDKKAPLNQIFRQLKLNRKHLQPHEQIQSEICFVNRKSLLFSNNFDLLREQISAKFPHCAQGFDDLVSAINAFLPFQPKPFQSAKTFLHHHITDSLLVDMLLCPLMYYGSSLENDMDLSQFVIMFRSIFQEGLFRPHGTMKDFLDLLLDQYKKFGGSIRTNCPVKRIFHEGLKVLGVELETGEVLHCDKLLSTIGYEETLALLHHTEAKDPGKRLGFMESIFMLPVSCRNDFPQTRTIIFYNQSETFRYERPQETIDLNSGVICFPANFAGLEQREYFEIRSTHLSDYQGWKSLENDPMAYLEKKAELSRRSVNALEKIIGKFSENIVYQDTFTPLTIERYTGKKEGAIYGCPYKIKGGKMGYDNLFLAGTDQGYLGIVGSILSGISMVNQHILPSL